VADPSFSSALSLSVRVGLACAAGGLLPAVGLGYLLARRRFPGKAALSTLLLLPMVLPPVVTGLLLLEAFGRHGVFGPALSALGVQVPFSILGAALAAGVVGLPLYTLVVRAAFEAVDPRYEEVAATLGEVPWRTFLRVTLPLALPGVLAGAVLAFGRALGEFGATVVLAGNVEGRTRTIALAVYSLLDAPGGESKALPLVFASIGLSALALGVYEGLLRRQRSRLEIDGGR
jgi:molybdate transport system permease protein